MEVTFNKATGEFVIRGTINPEPPLSKSEKSRILATTSGFVLTPAGKLSLNLIRDL